MVSYTSLPSELRNLPPVSTETAQAEVAPPPLIPPDLPSPVSPLSPSYSDVVGLGLRTLDEVLNVAPNTEVLEYGKYLHLMQEANDLLDGSRRDLKHALAIPWGPVQARAEAQGSTLRRWMAHLDVTSHLTASQKEVNMYMTAIGGTKRTIRVIHGTVQDLSASEITRHRPTVARLMANEEVVITGLGRSRSPPEVRLRFQVWRFTRINAGDRATILRAKLAECMDFSLHDCCKILDRDVPTIFLRSLRTEGMMVDWSMNYRGQRNQSEGPVSDPSVHWEQAS